MKPISILIELTSLQGTERCISGLQGTFVLTRRASVELSYFRKLGATAIRLLTRINKLGKISFPSPLPPIVCDPLFLVTSSLSHTFFPLKQKFEHCRDSIGITLFLSQTKKKKKNFIINDKRRNPATFKRLLAKK